MGQIKKKKLVSQVITHVQQIALLNKKVDVLKELLLQESESIDYLMKAHQNEIEAPIDESVDNVAVMIEEAGHRMTAIDTRIDAVVTNNAEIIACIKSAIDGHADVINAQNRIIGALRSNMAELVKHVDTAIMKKAEECGCKKTPKVKGAK